MVKEAQEHEAEDKKRRAAIDAKNQLDSLVLGVGKHFDENKDKIPQGDRGELEAALKDARDVLEANKEPKEGDVFKTAHERLQKASTRWPSPSTRRPRPPRPRTRPRRPGRTPARRPAARTTSSTRSTPKDPK